MIALSEVEMAPVILFFAAIISMEPAQRCGTFQAGRQTFSNPPRHHLAGGGFGLSDSSFDFLDIR